MDIPDDDQLAEATRRAFSKDTEDEPTEPSKSTEKKMTKSEVAAARDAWTRDGKPPCIKCEHVHPPPCRPEVLAKLRAREELKNTDPERWRREEDARIAEREQRIELAAAANREKQQNEKSAKPPKYEFKKSLTTPETYPLDFCTQCLARHRRPDAHYSYHLVSYHQALSKHMAIAAGAIPKVDPWADYKNAEEAKQAAQQASKQAIQGQSKRSELATSTYEPSEWMKRTFESASSGLSLVETVQGMNCMVSGANHELRVADRAYRDDHIQNAASASGPGSYANVASSGNFPPPGEQSTRLPGPPPKKRKAPTSGNRNQNQPDRNTRFKRSTPQIIQKAGAGRPLVPGASQHAAGENSAPNAATSQEPGNSGSSEAA